MSGIKLEGDWRRFDKHLQKMVNFGFLGLHKKIGEVLVSSAKKRFKTETGPDGTKWPKSIRAKAEKGQTMTDTAQLKNSITSTAKIEGVAYGTNLKKASTLQGKDGKSVTIKAKGKWLKFKVGGGWVLKKKVTIPARPFIGISKDDLEEIDATVKAHMEEKLR